MQPGGGAREHTVSLDKSVTSGLMSFMGLPRSSSGCLKYSKVFVTWPSASISSLTPSMRLSPVSQHCTGIDESVLASGSRSLMLTE
jgi:hypothetical protein